MSFDPTSHEWRFSEDVVRTASALSKRIQRGKDTLGLTKEDSSPVTVADYAVQAVVAKKLRETFPDAILVGEEDTGDLRDAKNSEVLNVVVDFVREMEPDATRDDVCAWIDTGAGEPCERFWTLDPIDGTKGYLRGGQYAVALALIEDGKVIFGALGCPNLAPDASPEGPADGLLVIAARGQGAWRTSLAGDSEWVQMKVSPRADVAQASVLRSVEAAHTNTSVTDQVLNHMGLQGEPVLMDSQAKYAVLAAGHAELLLRLLSPKSPDYREKIWDQAAGSIVLEEAGGKITDLAGKALDFSRGRTLAANRGVCASNGILHEAALAALTAVAGK